MKLLLLSSLFIIASSTSFAAAPSNEIQLIGSGTTCDEANEELMKEIAAASNYGVVTSISFKDCQAPDLAKPVQKAIIKLDTPFY